MISNGAIKLIYLLKFPAPLAVLFKIKIYKRESYIYIHKKRNKIKKRIGACRLIFYFSLFGIW